MPSVVIAAVAAIVVVVAATIAIVIRDEHSCRSYLLFRACTEAKTNPSLIISCLPVSRSHRQRLLPAA